MKELIAQQRFYYREGYLLSVIGKLCFVILCAVISFLNIHLISIWLY